MFKKIIMWMFLGVMVLQATAPTEENVAKLYVATFNRAPDTGGLNYWVNNSKLTLEQISISFFDQDETKDKYFPEGEGSFDADVFVTAIYRNLFNRDPDIVGKEYWVNEVKTGRISKGNMILAFINGAQGSDATMLDNKTRVGLAFANAELNNGVDAKNIMLGVTDDENTVTAALNKLLLLDVTAPVVTAPSNISVESIEDAGIAASAEAIAAFLTGASATDDIGVAGEISNDAPAVFPVGTTMVTFTALDAAGNSGTATATVTVSLSEDTNTTGSCVLVPRLETGDIFTIRTVQISDGTTVDVETTITDFSETSTTYNTISTGDLESTGETITTFTIANNYQDITKIVSNNVSTVFGFTVNTETILEFTPYLRRPVDRVCEGVSFVSEFDSNLTGTAGGVSIPEDSSYHKETITIESVNEMKTIGLGTFITVKVKDEDENGIVYSWIDTVTGNYIAAEEYDVQNTKVSTQELISHN